MYKYVVLFYISMCFTLLSCSKVNAQNFTQEEVKAAYIFSFAKYVTWKNEKNINQFVIGVLGTDKHYEVFKSVSAGQNLKNGSIGIARIKDISSIPYTHILFVGKEYCNDLINIKKNVKKNTLIVTDNCSDLESIMINFIDDDPSRKFELNIKNILLAELEISKKIVTLGGGQEANWQDLFETTDKQLDDTRKKLKEQLAEIEKQQQIIDEKTKILAEQEASISVQQDSLNIQKEEITKNKQILNMHKFAIQTQEGRIAEQEAILGKQMSEIKKQKLILYLFGILSILIIGLAYFIYRSYKIKKKANLLLEQKNEEITQVNLEILLQKEEIEAQRDQISGQNERLVEQNEAINQQKEELESQRDQLEEFNIILGKTNDLLTSSINYAKKIQDALLPADFLIKQILPQSFVYFRPRDIVSGDFYWVSEKGDEVFIAAVDCTGHGVPGAFMSMIGNSLLNDIIKERHVNDPAQALNKMNERVIATLQQGQEDNGDSQDDGMDVTLCKIDRNKKELQIACANHTAYFIRENKLQIIEGDIFSIGDPLAKIREVKYTNHTLSYQEGDLLYMFSDGYQDQFGGNENKKFMAGRMQKMILENCSLNMQDQAILFDTEFKNWKKNTRQLDDVLVIGIRF